MQEVISFNSTPPDRNEGPTILVVDDERSGRAAMRLALEEAQAKTDEPFVVLEASNLTEAFAHLSSHRVDAVLLDKVLIGSDGTKENGILEIPRILHICPLAQVLVMTSSGDVQDAVIAGRLGAFGFVSKTGATELIVHQVKTAIRMGELRRQQARHELKTSKPVDGGISGHSPVIRQVLSRADAVAESNRPVLLLGETGTGKTTLARYIHERRRTFLKERDRPFVALNVAALSPDLVEGELFGSEAGAFTDAKQLKVGFIELANNGTLFLDEIGDAPDKVQAKLLKVLDEKKFYRVGGKKELTSQFKLVCATHRNLAELVKQGTFREDLYMRISTFAIEMPSLEQRQSDIPEIIRSALPKWSQENGIYVKFEDLPEDFVERLTTIKIQGNIRGLEQIISRLIVLAPRDGSGRPVLSRWKEILDFSSPKTSHARKGVVTLQDLEKCRLDVVGPEFPGYQKFMDFIEEKVFRDAAEKNASQSKIAKALKLTPSAVSQRFRKRPITASSVPETIQ